MKLKPKKINQDSSLVIALKTSRSDTINIGKLNQKKVLEKHSDLKLNIPHDQIVDKTTQNSRRKVKILKDPTIIISPKKQHLPDSEFGNKQTVKTKINLIQDKSQQKRFISTKYNIRKSDEQKSSKTQKKHIDVLNQAMDYNEPQSFGQALTRIDLENVHNPKTPKKKTNCESGLLSSSGKKLYRVESLHCLENGIVKHKKFYIIKEKDGIKLDVSKMKLFEDNNQKTESPMNQYVSKGAATIRNLTQNIISSKQKWDKKEDNEVSRICSINDMDG